MTPSRRSFLAWLGLAPAAAVVAPKLIEEVAKLPSGAPPLMIGERFTYSHANSALMASFQQTKEIFAADLLNTQFRPVGLAPLDGWIEDGWSDEDDEA